MLTEKKVRIGFPRALLYHKYAPLWTHFFRSIGCQIVTSPNTNRAILDQGVRCSIDENCLAVKVFLGHVAYLIGKVDYIFIPRIRSLHAGEMLCVKLFALADIVRNTFDSVPILECSVDVEKRQDAATAFIQVGQHFNISDSKIQQAYDEALREQAKQKLDRLNRQLMTIRDDQPSGCRVLLVAHPYVTYDALLGKTVVQILEGLGAQVIYADVVDEATAQHLSPMLSTDCYWTYNKELLGGIQFYRDHVDGIIFLMAFPCGPDALIATLCQYSIHDLPLCVLNMDELQGDAGLKTRLESFLDILQLKKEKQS